MKFLFPCLFLLIFLSSCTKDRDILPADQAPVTPVTPGSLLINEIVAKGSVNANEFGQNSDWFEIYNPGNTSLQLDSGRWFVTDKLINPEKFLLPELTIPSKGYLVIWCDTLGVVATQIHANFGLNASGEEIGLYFKNDADSLIQVDACVYPAQLYDGYSTGRMPDGSSNWVSFPSPTPGASNQ